MLFPFPGEFIVLIFLLTCQLSIKKISLIHIPLDVHVILRYNSDRDVQIATCTKILKGLKPDAVNRNDLYSSA